MKCLFPPPDVVTELIYYEIFISPTRCRYGASELHSVAAFMGGVAAHEVIKVITGQFIPVNNTYIYNAMKQTSCTLDL